MIREATGSDTGTIIKEIDIAAPPSVVWKALTEPDHLVNWLPLEASVQPGKGGTMRLTWGDPVTQESTIDVWEPEKHLRLKETMPFGVQFEPAEAKLAPAPRVVDYELKPNGKKTTLQLTHSGFTTGLPHAAAARSMAEMGQVAELAGLALELSPLGFRNTVADCWNYQLNALGDYCENHTGQVRSVSWVRLPIQTSFPDAWSRLSGPGSTGLLHSPAAAETRLDPSVKTAFAAGLQPGDRYSFRTSTGDTFTGKVLTYKPNKQFGGTVDNMNGILRILLSYTVGRPDLSMWLARYGEHEKVHGVTEQRWNRLFEQRWTYALAKAL
jgi:uncharacterized protein YndB with AHSA1/START domain